MDASSVERLIYLFDRSRISELELVEGGTQIRLMRDGRPTLAHVDVQPDQQGNPADRPPPPAMPRAGDATSRHVITAGLFGVFYRARSPGEDPFVVVGNMVTEGQTLAILEAMKTLIAVEADRAGRIEAILVEDGSTVEAGTPLLTIIAVE